MGEYQRKYASGTYGQPFQPNYTYDINGNIIRTSNMAQGILPQQSLSANQQLPNQQRSIIQPPQNTSNNISMRGKQAGIGTNANIPGIDKSDFSLKNMFTDKQGNYTFNSVIGPAKTAFDIWSTMEGIGAYKDSIQMMKDDMAYSQMDTNRKFALTSDQYWKDNNRRMGSRADYDKRNNGGEYFTQAEYDQHMANRNSGKPADGFYDGVNSGINYVPGGNYTTPGSVPAASSQMLTAAGAQSGSVTPNQYLQRAAEAGNPNVPAGTMNNFAMNAQQPTQIDQGGHVKKKRRERKRAPSESPESGSDTNQQIV